MRRYRGSFSVEAAFIVPLVLLCMFIAIDVGISLYGEVEMQVESQQEERVTDMVGYMYRSEFIKELFGELYED
ncbi:MAG: pilus assembly protein [Roseburia sp.]|nr:pilus assembly protein [Roseburia sp.]